MPLREVQMLKIGKSSFCRLLKERLITFRWGPLMGLGKAFDMTRYLIICLNTMGSPYGSASPLTINPDSGEPYGPEFPPTTIRDDVL